MRSDDRCVCVMYKVQSAVDDNDDGNGVGRERRQQCRGGMYRFDVGLQSGLRSVVLIMQRSRRGAPSSGLASISASGWL